MIFIDMPMPKCCDECFALDESGDYPHCLISHDQRGYTFNTLEQRMPTCPLKLCEPRILTYDEILEVDRDAVWLQLKNDPIIEIGIVTFGTEDKLEFFIPSEFGEGPIILRKENYGETWVAWSARPTDEQRRDTPWE